MGIYKRNGVYYANYFNERGTRCRPSLHTKDKRIAEIKFAELRQKTNTIKNISYTPNLTFKDFLLKFDSFIKTEKAKNTQDKYHIAIKYLEEVKRINYLSDITPELLQKLKEHLISQGKGAHGINRYISVLKAMMRTAEKWKLISPQEWSLLSKIRTPRGRVEFHTEKEIKKLLEAAPSLDWQIIIRLGARAGLRRGEIAALRWKDVNFKERQLYVAPNKTDKHRFVPIAPDLLKALKTAQKHAKNDFVVNIGSEGSRWTKDYLTSYYREIAQRANVKSFLHKLRHTFASHLVQAGVDLYSVSKLMGHSSIKMTEIYAHLAPKTLQEAILKLPKID
jgi:integrase